MNTKSAPRTAILGWGSLIWDQRPEFDTHHEPWLPGGPILKLEFSRISSSRKDALTLVIDNEHGTMCETNYCVSNRKDPDDAISDLRCREGTILRHIGYYYADGSRTCRPQVPESIASWAAENGFDVVVWTGLPSNFKEMKNKDFSIENAIAHLQSLTPEGKSMAAMYIWRAPAFVKTRLRMAVEVEPWFACLDAKGGAAAKQNNTVG